MSMSLSILQLYNTLHVNACDIIVLNSPYKSHLKKLIITMTISYFDKLLSVPYKSPFHSPIDNGFDKVLVNA